MSEVEATLRTVAWVLTVVIVLAVLISPLVWRREMAREVAEPGRHQD